jgi:hypothetical protein
MPSEVIDSNPLSVIKIVGSRFALNAKKERKTGNSDSELLNKKLTTC